MITIDEANETISDDSGGATVTVPLGSPEGFAMISRLWLRSGWDVKHIWSFTWLGRPIIQLPEDMFRIQEVIHQVRPDVIIETGVAHGGSLVFYASLCTAMGHGRVIGIDIDIRAHNRKALEAHALKPLIDLVEGSSILPETVAQVRDLVKPGESAMVILDSNHSRDHVLGELRAYCDFVTPGSYIVACDGIMAGLVGAPRANDDWDWNNPVRAVEDFLAENSDFEPSLPPFAFNEGLVDAPVTYWPSGYLRRT